MTGTERAQLTYVTDTYCIWCWAFGDALREFAEVNRGRLSVDVLPAGMLVGERVVPVGQKERVLEGAQRVTEMTGAEFGDGFRDAVREGSTVLDSNVSAVAFWALLRQAPDRPLDIAHALQKAWYVDGLDLARPEVIEGVARELNMDPAQAVQDVNDPAVLAQAQAGFERRKTLPVTGYPTLLVHTPGGPKRMGGAKVTPEKLAEQFDLLMSGGELPTEEE